VFKLIDAVCLSLKLVNYFGLDFDISTHTHTHIHTICMQYLLFSYLTSMYNPRP